VGLVLGLAGSGGCASDGDYFARKVPESSALVFNSALRLAFLVGLCWLRLAPPADCGLCLHTVDREALMPSAFRKISRVGTLAGGTRWYLSEDCLLAAKRVMYTVEYRRFYLRDLEWIAVWPSRLWSLRPIIPGLLLIAAGGSVWHFVNFTGGAIFGGAALAWVALELALGPTVSSRIRTTGLTVDLPLVKRARRARKVLAKIDAAVRAARGDALGQVTAPISGTQQAQPSTHTSPEASPTATPAGGLT
jgi:hypothetical protein